VNIPGQVYPMFDAVERAVDSAWTDEENTFFTRHRALKYANRCLNIQHASENYTVAEHTSMLGIFALIVFDEFDEYNANHPLSATELSQDKRYEILRRILLHDVSESVTGDIPYFVGLDNEKYIEDTIEARGHTIFSSEALNEEVLAGDYDGPVELFVRVLDFVELAMFCLEQEIAGTVVIDHTRGTNVLDVCLELMKTKCNDCPDSDWNDIFYFLRDRICDRFIDEVTRIRKNHGKEV